MEPSIYDARQHLPIKQDFPGLQAACLEPPIYLAQGFLSAEQCEGIMEWASDEQLATSRVHNGTHNSARTSCSCDLGSEWAEAVAQQVVRLTGSSPEQMEIPTVARYLRGQHYVAHHDAFPPGDPMLGCGGNRICTVLIYLNDVAEGGRTLFHRAGLSVAPRAGMAVVFFPSDCASGEIDPLTLHEAEPAVCEKWVVQVWVRQRSLAASRMDGRHSHQREAAHEPKPPLMLQPEPEAELEPPPVDLLDALLQRVDQSAASLMLNNSGLDVQQLATLHASSHPQLAAVTELDLSVNCLTAVPPALTTFTNLRALYLGGPHPNDDDYDRRNKITRLPATLASALARTLEKLSLHDNELRDLPELHTMVVLRELRLDRNPLGSLPALPTTLEILHLEGCPLPGSIEDVRALPPTLIDLAPVNNLADLQLPTGDHIGTFFGASLGEMLAQAEAHEKGT